MSLKSVQTYEVNANGVLNPVPGLVFATDTTGTVVLGGKCNDIQINSYVLDRNYFDNRYERGPQLHFEADGSKPQGDSPGTPQYGTSAAITAGVNNSIVNGQASFIGAGQENLISGETRAVYVRYAQLINNQVYGSNYETHNSFGSKSFIGAGSANKILSPKSAIIGGHGNVICGSNNFPSWELTAQTLPGTEEFTPYAPLYYQYDDDDFMRPVRVINAPGYNVIAGGKNNYLNNIYSVIGGGVCNGMFSERCVRFAPSGPQIPYPSELSGQYNFIGGGFCNNLYNSKTAVIAGGTLNIISVSDNSSIAGGCRNLISGGGGSNNTLAGGFWNTILGGAYQFMGGGYRNIISGASLSSLIGGSENSIVSSNIRGRAADQLNIIAGGSCNSISGCLNSILGGRSNLINGSLNAILAGSENIIKDTSCVTILAGYKVSGIHDGSTIIGDRTNRFKISDNKDALTLDFISGTYIKNKIIFQSDNYVPSNHTSFGISGQISYDKNYLYRHNGDYWTKVPMVTGENDASIYATTNNLFLTGSVLAASNSNYSGWAKNTYATVSNLFSTGSVLATISNLFSTGSSLATANTNYSGWANNTYATVSNLFLTGSQITSRITGISVQDEGSNLGQVKTLNFVGAGVSASVANATATITVGGGVSFVSAPATPNSAGSNGQIATDSNYFYSHNGSKWRRTALAEW